MSLKAGRVGVAPDQVDEFGKIKSEATSGYTKQEADAKFETKTDAATALAEKQPKTLAVPIEMLSGTKLTVESALQGLNDATTALLTGSEIAFTDIVEGAAVDSSFGGNHLVKKGNIVIADLGLKTVTTSSAWSVVIAKIPDGYRPKTEVYVRDARNQKLFVFRTNGNLNCSEALSEGAFYVHAVWTV